MSSAVKRFFRILHKEARRTRSKKFLIKNIPTSVYSVFCGESSFTVNPDFNGENLELTLRYAKSDQVRKFPFHSLEIDKSAKENRDDDA